MGSGFGTLELRRVGRTGRRPMPNSACVPGQTRIFVSGAGAFYPCENYDRAGGEIGCCRHGIDFAKAQKLLQNYARLCNRMCQGCWARRLCAHCYIHASDRDGRLSQVCKEKNCRREKEEIVKALHRYVSILRNEPARASRVRHTLRYSSRRLETDP
jgi:radical SAM protein with 4Fe4S-binding SPASM domain